MLSLFPMPWKLARKKSGHQNALMPAFLKKTEVKIFPLDSTGMKYLIIQPGQSSRWNYKNTMSNREFAKHVGIMHAFSRSH